MTKADKTKAYIIERSAAVFNTKGYAATSLSDLMDVTGLTKGSIYGNFENKNDLAVSVYKHSVCALNKKVSELISYKSSPIDKLIAYTEYYRQNWKMIFENGGCTIQNASIEADDSAVFLKKHVQASIKSWATFLARIIQEGKNKGIVKKNIAAKHYAYTIIFILEGGIMLSKIMNDHRLLFDALDRIVYIINTELKK